MTGLVKALIDSGHLQVEGTEYPTLDVTRRGQEVLQGTCAVAVKQAEEVQPDSSAEQPSLKRAAFVAAPRTLPADPQLFERLRQLRTVLAEEEDVAPFLIFHDKTLKAIASHKPVTPAALLEISGIGALKAERYGRRVLQVVNGEE